MPPSRPLFRRRKRPHRRRRRPRRRRRRRRPASAVATCRRHRHRRRRPRRRWPTRGRLRNPSAHGRRLRPAGRGGRAGTVGRLSARTGSKPLRSAAAPRRRPSPFSAADSAASRPAAGRSFVVAFRHRRRRRHRHLGLPRPAPRRSAARRGRSRRFYYAVVAAVPASGPIFMSHGRHDPG